MSIINCICATVVKCDLVFLSVSISEYIFISCVMCVSFLFFFHKVASLLGL